MQDIILFMFVLGYGCTNGFNLTQAVIYNFTGIASEIQE